MNTPGRVVLILEKALNNRRGIVHAITAMPKDGAVAEETDASFHLIWGKTALWPASLEMKSNPEK
jgi:hypothetical protein